jgi:hypothetical protein
MPPGLRKSVTELPKRGFHAPPLGFDQERGQIARFASASKPNVLKSSPKQSQDDRIAPLVLNSFIIPTPGPA